MMNAKQAFEFLRERTGIRCSIQVDVRCEQSRRISLRGPRPNPRSVMWIRVAFESHTASFSVGGRFIEDVTRIDGGALQRPAEVDAEDFEPAARAALDQINNWIIAMGGAR